MPGKGKPMAWTANGPKPPCGKDCPDRKPGCAADCGKWKAYVAERNANYEKRKTECMNGDYSEAGKRSFRQREQTNKRKWKRRGGGYD